MAEKSILTQAKYIAEYKVWPRVLRELDYNTIKPQHLNAIVRAISPYSQAIALCDAGKLTPAELLSWDSRFGQLIKEANEG